jgi:transposase
MRTGAPWRDLPSEFGPWNTAYNHFARWRDAGVFTTVVHDLQRLLFELDELRNELWCVDGTNIRAARAAAGGKKKLPA